MKKGRLYCVNHNLLHDIHEFFIHKAALFDALRRKKEHCEKRAYNLEDKCRLTGPAR